MWLLCSCWLCLVLWILVVLCLVVWSWFLLLDLSSWVLLISLSLGRSGRPAARISMPTPPRPCRPRPSSRWPCYSDNAIPLAVAHNRARARETAFISSNDVTPSVPRIFSWRSAVSCRDESHGPVTSHGVMNLSVRRPTVLVEVARVGARRAEETRGHRARTAADPRDRRRGRTVGGIRRWRLAGRFLPAVDPRRRPRVSAVQHNDAYDFPSGSARGATTMFRIRRASVLAMKR